MGLKDTLRKGKIIAGSVLAAATLMAGASASAQENQPQTPEKQASLQMHSQRQRSKQELEKNSSGRPVRVGDAVEVTNKTKDGGYVVWNSKTHTTEFYYSDGKMQSSYDGKTGKFVGFYPDGSKRGECENFDAPFYEYYPNGQLKATPVPQPRNLHNYQVFSEDGKVIASHESQSAAKEIENTQETTDETFYLPDRNETVVAGKRMTSSKVSVLQTTSQWTLYNPETGKKTAGYTIKDSGPQADGWLTEIRLYDENGKEQKISLENGKTRHRLQYRENGAVRPLSEKVLRQIAKKEQTKNLALNMGSSR